MVDFIQELQKWYNQANAVDAQSKADALQMQKETVAAQLDAMREINTNQELRALKEEAVLDSFNSTAQSMVNWAKVVLGEQEQDYAKSKGIAEDQEASQAIQDAEFDMKNDPFDNMNYLTDADEIATMNKEAEGDLDGDDSDIGEDPEKWLPD